MTLYLKAEFEKQACQGCSYQPFEGRIGKGTIADFFIHGKDGRADYSLKTTDKKAKIGGSVTSLVKSIKDKPMIYYVFAKEKGSQGSTASVTVYKFEINIKNVGKILRLTPKEVQELVQSEKTGDRDWETHNKS